jgi:hypothetical protein
MNAQQVVNAMIEIDNKEGIEPDAQREIRDARAKTVSSRISVRLEGKIKLDSCDDAGLRTANRGPDICGVLKSTRLGLTGT